MASIARVIPLRRSPRGKEFFDYRIPAGLSLKPGNLVHIPFRQQMLLGIVHKVVASSGVAHLRSIHDVVPSEYHLTSQQLKFLEWFSNYYYVSRSLAAKTLLTPLPRRRMINQPTVDASAYDTLPAKTSPSMEAIIKKLQRIHIVRFQQRRDCLDLYKAIIRSSKNNGAVLIVAPEYRDVAELHNALHGTPGILLHSFHKRPGATQYYDVMDRVRNNPTEQHVLIGTKRLIFFPMEYVRILIIDQEDEKSHKQFDQNPRYHVRTIALELFKLYRHGGLQLLLSSRAPSVVLSSQHLPMINIARPWRPRRILLVDMEMEKRRGNYSWFSEVLQDRIRHAHRTFLFLNRSGTFRIAVCNDCGTLLPLTTFPCSTCASHNIQRRGKGVQQLATECQKLFPHKRVLHIDRNVAESAQSALRTADIIIGTEKAYRLLPLATFSLLGILSVDHLLVYPHWQAHERVFQLLARLFSFDIPTIVQTHAPHHHVLRAAVTNNYQLFLNEELAMRRALHVPPYGDFIELHDLITHAHTVVTTPPNPTTLATSIIVDRAS